MFDNIIIKIDLDLPIELKEHNIDWSKKEFQTKDLDNCLGTYTITKEGKLVETVVQNEYVPYTEQEKKEKNIKSWDLWKDVIEKSREEVPVNFHGKIRFYTYEKFDDLTDFWLEYDAYFIYGSLDKIILVEFKTEESLSIRNRKIDEKRKREQNTVWFEFKKVASYFGWRWFWLYLAKKLNKTASTLAAIQTFIYRVML